MKEDAIGLWDGVLLEVLPDLHVAFGAPGGAGLIALGLLPPVGLEGERAEAHEPAWDTQPACPA
jgi:hypothetical protein